MLSGREASVLAALIEAFVPRGADRDAVATGVATALGRLAPHRRTQLLQFLRLLDAPAFVFAFTGRPTRFSLAAPEERERTLRAFADHPLAPLRSGFNAFKRLVLFLAYAHDDEQTRNPLWPGIRYPGPRNDVPGLLSPVQTATPLRGSRTADVVVVGSGAGGGVAAALFAAAGYRAIVLEAGPPADGVAAQQREAFAVGSLYLESGLAATTDLGVSILAGACVGGGTTINWCTSLRLREAVAEQWSRAVGIPSLPSELNAAYEAVERRLAIVPAPDHNANNAVIARGSERLGWSCATLPRNASGCGDGCGYCGFGCAYGNKRGTAATYLRDAVSAGAEVYANVRVDRVRVESGRALGVDATVEGGSMRVDAPLVVLAAGTLRTPGILARSGIASAHLGRHLRLHPVTPLAAEFDERIEPWIGPIQSALSDRLIDIDDGYGVAIECAPVHPGLAALALSWRSAEQHAAEMARLANTAVLIALTRDRGEGSVSLDGRDDIRYRLAGYDAGHLLQGVVAAATLAFSAGARRVSTFHSDPIVLERDGARHGGLERFSSAVRARSTASNRLLLFSAHQMGTARMSANPRGGVVDPYGAVYGVDGLLVVDGSAFPLSSGVNPMLTIMALAFRAATHRIAVRPTG